MIDIFAEVLNFKLGPVHMGSQVPLMLASSNMEEKSQLLSLKETMEIWLIIMKVISWLIYANQVTWLVLKVGSSFFLNPIPNTIPKPHL